MVGENIKEKKPKLLVLLSMNVHVQHVHVLATPDSLMSEMLQAL